MASKSDCTNLWPLDTISAWSHQLAGKAEASLLQPNIEQKKESVLLHWGALWKERMWKRSIIWHISFKQASVEI